jgi:transcription antitermination factor NusG
MFPSWDNMMRERDFTGDGGGDDWYEGVNPQRYDVPMASEKFIQVIPNGVGWTDAFKHAALAGGMGAVGGLLFGPIGAVGGLLTGLAMSTSVLQSHARETARINHQYMSGVSRERRMLERQTQQERLAEQRRRKAMETNSREDEWTRFIEEKKAAAVEILRTYNIARYSLAVVSRQKAVIEIPWHTPWQLRRQLNDVLEAALQMRAVSVSVRFCDGCGGKLAGPVTEALVCPLCGRRFCNEIGPVQVAYVQKPAPAPKLPQPAPQPQAVQIPPVAQPAVQPQVAPTLAQTPPSAETVEDLLADDDFVDEKAGPLTEYQMEELLEAEDYEARLTAENVDPAIVMQDILSRTNKPEPLQPSPPQVSKKAAPATPPTTALPALTQVTVPAAIAQDAKEKTVPVTPPATAPSFLTQATKPAATEPPANAEIAEGGKVQALGKYKGLKGTVQEINKHKRRAKVLLDEYETTVNIALELLAPLEVPLQ